jgi:hypothetical protein
VFSFLTVHLRAAGPSDPSRPPAHVPTMSLAEPCAAEFDGGNRLRMTAPERLARSRWPLVFRDYLTVSCFRYAHLSLAAIHNEARHERQQHSDCHSRKHTFPPCL